MPRSDYWIKIFDSLPGHWKTRHIQKAMGWSKFETVGFLTTFWLQVASDAPDGVLDGLVSVNDVLKAVGLKNKSRKEKDQFFRVTNALLGCNLIEESDNGCFILHDWEDGAGKLQKTRAGDTVRQRNRRSRDGDPKCHADVTRESKSKEKETPPYPPQAGGEFKFFENLVLDTWRQECERDGRTFGRDRKTVLGAGKLAKALLAGEFAPEDLQTAMRGFLGVIAADPARATWDLNTLAAKPASYIPRKRPPPPSTADAPAPPPTEPMVKWRWRCDVCGFDTELTSRESEGVPEPMPCVRGLGQNRCQGIMHVIEKGDEIDAAS